MLRLYSLGEDLKRGSVDKVLHHRFFRARIKPYSVFAMLANQENNRLGWFPYRNSTPFTSEYRCSRSCEVIPSLLTFPQSAAL